MKDLLNAELEKDLKEYVKNRKRAGTIALVDFIPSFLWLVRNNVDLPKRLERIVPWCQRWIDSEDCDETFMLEKKISLVIDLYLEVRKYNAD